MDPNNISEDVSVSSLWLFSVRANGSSITLIVTLAPFPSSSYRWNIFNGIVESPIFDCFKNWRLPGGALLVVVLLMLIGANDRVNVGFRGDTNRQVRHAPVRLHDWISSKAAKILDLILALATTEHQTHDVLLKFSNNSVTYLTEHYYLEITQKPVSLRR